MSGENKKKVRTTRSRVQQKAADIDMNFVVSNIAFPSIPRNLFRFIVSSVSKDEVFFKLEKLRSPHVWLCSVKDISEFGNAGLPRAAVLNVLKDALSVLTVNLLDHDQDMAALKKEDGTESEAGDASAGQFSSEFPLMKDPRVDAILNDDGSVTVELDIPVGGIPMVYAFDISVLKREHIDVLESSLNDARDEIRVLQSQVARFQEMPKHAKLPSIVLRTTETNGPNTVIVWNTLQHHEDGEEKTFIHSPDKKSIIINIPGLYMVNARVMSPDSSGSRHLELRMNDTAISSAYMGFNTGHNSSVYLNDIIRVEQSAEQKSFSLFFSGNQNMNNGVNNSHFTIMRIA